MITLTITEACAHLDSLLNEVAATRQPILIAGERGNAVLASEEDWRAIEETVYLLNKPGMRESIIEGMNTPLDECLDKVEW